MAGKGSAFERQVCGDLSSWWTGDENASVFWRTANSGGRATVRGRKGKQTQGHAGDICATDPVADPLLKKVTFELKRGYSKHTVFDLVDRPAHHNKQVWEDWINQARRSQQTAGSVYWMIIHRRDKRPAVCVYPYRMWRVLGGEDSGHPDVFLSLELIDTLRQPYRIKIVAEPFEKFLTYNPEHVTQL